MQLPPGARAPAFPPLTRISRWRAELDVDEAGTGCLEISWRPVMPAGPALIDVAAVDDHPIILDSIAGWVSGLDSGIRVIATAATVDDLLAGPGRARAGGPARPRPGRRDHGGA